jgi:hypothetical protein
MGAAAVAAIAVGLATYGFSRNDQKNPDASAVQTAKEGAPEKENKHPAMLQNVDMQHPENTTLALLGGAQLKPKAAWKFGEASFGTMYDCQPSEVEPLLKSLYSSDPDLWECIKSRLIGEQHNGNSVRAYGYTSPSGTIIDVCDHCTIIISADGRMKYFLSEVSGGNPKTDDPKKIQTYEAVDKKRFTSGTSGRYNCPELIQILGEIPNKEPSSEDGDGKGYIHKRIKMFRAGVKNYGPNKEIKVVNKI